ncbi:putative membrane protein [Desulfohalotomaculum tongense]|nr:putative membrane protein [Desulforadius tongensis]
MAEQISFFKRKNVQISVQRYLVQAMGFMALGLFASLIIGLIIKTFGQKLNVDFLVQAGSLAMDKNVVGAAIGVAVAHGLQAPPLVLFASAVTGAAGYLLGGPAGSFVSGVIGAEFGKMVSRETPVDIIVTPVVTILAGFAAAGTVGPVIGSGMKQLGNFIEWATELHPVPMGILVAVVMGLSLTAPISSAALAIMMELSGLAAGAATVGCAAQMIGFAVISYRENGVGGLLAQGLGTSMLQIPNIVKNPWIILPPTIAGALLGPLATAVFKMSNIHLGAGMGTAGLVGQFTTVTAMGFNGTVLMKILMLHFIAPALLSLAAAAYMRRWGLIREGDMKLDL